MSRFNDDWAAFAEIAEIIAARTDFDLETVEDLIEAVGPDMLYDQFLGPAIDKIAERIGLEKPDLGSVTLPEGEGSTVGSPSILPSAGVTSVVSGKAASSGPELPNSNAQQYRGTQPPQQKGGP